MFQRTISTPDRSPPVGARSGPNLLYQRRMVLFRESSKGLPMKSVESCSPAPRHEEQGTVLILAVLMMTALITFGIAYLSATSLRLQAETGAVDRVRARAMADSAVEHVYYTLRQDPTARRVTPLTLSGAEYSVDLHFGTRHFKIVATGASDSGAEVSLLSYGEFDYAPAVSDTLRATSIVLNGDKTTFTWDGDAISASVEENGGSTASGTWAEDLAAPGFVFDAAEVRERADTIYDASLLIEGGLDDNNPTVLKGVIFVDGILTIESPVHIEGTIYATGGIDFIDPPKGTNYSVTVVPGDSQTVLASEGDITFNGRMKTVSVTGMVFSGGDVVFDGIKDVIGIGAISANGAIVATDTDVTWSYVEDAVSDDPFGVTGIDPTLHGAAELWRFPTSTPDDG